MRIINVRDLVVDGQNRAPLVVPVVRFKLAERACGPDLREGPKSCNT